MEDLLGSNFGPFGSPRCLPQRPSRPLPCTLQSCQIEGQQPGGTLHTQAQKGPSQDLAGQVGGLGESRFAQFSLLCCASHSPQIAPVSVCDHRTFPSPPRSGVRGRAQSQFPTSNLSGSGWPHSIPPSSLSTSNGRLSSSLGSAASPASTCLSFACVIS